MHNSILKTTLSAVALLALSACGPETSETTATSSENGQISERYVKVILGIGEHENGYIDAYYGPKEWAEAVKNNSKDLAELKAEVASLQKLVDKTAPTAKTEIEKKRFIFLAKQLIAADARIRMLQGEKFSFDEETRLLFDAVAPKVTKDELEAALAKLEDVVEGEGPLRDRYLAFTQQYNIPADKLDAVFDAAIQACKAKTAEHLDLPENESFTTEFVTDKPWSGYNWYQGGANSLIQVNTDLPSPMSAAVNLGCHEGYPGHHVYNAMLEQKLVNERGWTEYSVYPLYSPQSFIAEGTASYGRFMAFPGAEQNEFEKTVLYPLAGLDPAMGDQYRDTLAALKGLSYARIEGARRYLDGQLTREETIDWLARYNLISRERAEQSLDFIETYRGYVINYTLGADLSEAYVDKHGGTDHSARWDAYEKLLSEPFTASMMKD